MMFSQTRRIAVTALLLALGAPAQQPSDADADYFFNRGAERYSRDDVESARRWVNEGLAQYPSEPKLILLKQLLEKPPQPQASSTPQPDQSDQNKSETSSQEQEESKTHGSANGEEHDRSAPPDSTSETLASMSKEDAEQLLDALSNRELAERARMGADRIRRQMGRLPPVEKDW
ncbi:MAG: hypothetical protein NZ740_08515 [Kiritimatiellae bacterium]|nr:hypothetical protein [Kiritimatiellia bacterium]MDW8459136.1 hypothetical protein [Verrucomicrobiota bacterium]